MKIAVSSPGKYHHFHLARQLQRLGVLSEIFSAYPRFKLKDEGIHPQNLHTFGWFHTPFMALARYHLLNQRMSQKWERVTKQTFDAHVAGHIKPCDAFIGLSSASLNTGKVVQSRGGKYISDRPCAHIRVQNQLLRAEHDKWGIQWRGIDPWIIDREEREYEVADCVTVASTFALKSFLDMGVPRSKLRVLQYGVDLRRFSPDRPYPPLSEFNVLFVGAVSLQKGIPYLLKAFQMIQHPKKSLTLVGSCPPAFISRMKHANLWSDSIEIRGHVQNHELKQVMNRSHVLVLPSVQDGFGMVMAEAMACARPVIATTHTGGPDLITDGVDGFIVPASDDWKLADRLQAIADTPGLGEQLGEAAHKRTSSFGGWDKYGEDALACIRSL